MACALYGPEASGTLSVAPRARARSASLQQLSDAKEEACADEVHHPVREHVGLFVEL